MTLTDNDLRDQGRAAAPDAFVRFAGVGKTYDGRVSVVDNLNLDIARGEFLTLLGPSGSGKTTTLLMLAGFEAATSGDILIDGLPVTHLPPHKRGIGMVFQNYALFPHMTVAQNLAFPLQVRKASKSEIQTKVKRALGMVQLQGFEQRRPTQLSGGQQQRVAVARALVFEPKLVLMDEPLGALDKQLREQMQYEIKRIHRETGVTVVYVTHDQGEALTMSDRIAVFNDGCISQIDGPEALYEDPANAFVAGFIGENNHVPGEIVAVNGDEVEARVATGVHFRARNVNCGGVGDAVQLAIRPERVAIDPPASDLFTRLSGRVADIYYLGDHVRLTVEFAPKVEVIAKVPNAEGAVRLRHGDPTIVGWRTADCRAFAPIAGHHQPHA